jgi:hypothetical protein
LKSETFLNFEGEEMKKFLVALFVVAAAAMVVVPAYATELWDPHLRGLNEGLAAGALPPPGLYFINNSYFAPSYKAYGNLFNPILKSQVAFGPSGHSNSDAKLFAYVDVPVLLWVPGWKFLGADYAMGIAEPFDYTNLRVKGGLAQSLGLPAGASLSGSQWGMFNTILIPYSLSWKLPCDFFIKHSLGIALNDGTSNPGTQGTLGNTALDSASMAPSSNGYYWFDPTLGVSWLHNGWNASIDFHYSFPLKDTGTGYTSGQQIAVDYTITKTCGKWTVGVGIAEETQTTNDSWGSIPVGTPFNGADQRANAWTIGPIVGYNFGPCSLQFIYNFPLYVNNDVGGEWFDVRFVVPLWK